MAFLSPLALVSALIIGPIIVAMYLLKLRREERRVSSTFLWQRVVRDVEANAPWQKLRRNLLLLLQLLLLALLVLALARPFLRTTGIAGRNLIVIVDRSASMAATDIAPNRLAAAKRQAITLIDQLPDDGRATLIAAGGQTEILVSASTDRRQLRDAIDSIGTRSGGGSDLAPALTLAAALSAREAESEIAIISDGNVRPLDALQPVPATVRYFPIGQGGENVAVSAMALQPSPAGQTLFVQATNYGQGQASRRLDLYLDDQLFNAYSLTIAPGADQSIIANIPAQARKAEARLVEAAGGDALPLDDRAWAVSSVGEGTNVRLVSPGNRFLEVGLAGLPSIKATLVPTSTAAFTETAAQIPVTIFDSVVPATLPPGNLFFIAPPRSTEFFSVTGQVDFPALRPSPGDEPLLRNVKLSDVSVLKANTLVPGAWAHVVVDGDGGPMLVAGERDGRRIVVLAFDLHNSDLPVQIAFPLLLSNIVAYLAPGSGAEAAQLAPDQPLAVAVDPSITAVRVTHPGGAVAELALRNGQAIDAETDAPGVYTVEQFQGDKLVARQRYAVNLFAPDESKIAPQAELKVPQTSGLQQATTSERVGRQEFWRWLAALALIVLVIEWLVYQRNGIAYLRQRWRERRARTA
ncbi:MAG TPA: BatA and WFA domain-containing protein [Kouleothrix sp.]|uniref:vWA domain-containing protein n=1 Tax=Kouleothrix sp. TaxID=2779161 RepID=UPI002CCA9B75|nr:BatA and WFA domain-containing protein [Kouleothrix sp.]